MFPDKCFGFSLDLVDKFSEVVQNSFEPVIGPHQELIVSESIVF